MKIVFKLILKIPSYKYIMLEAQILSFSKFNTTGFPPALEYITICLIKN